MKLKSLKIKNFRNYDLLNIELDEKTNIFYGDNAQGKTNILEAIYLSATSKSHRSSKDRELIKFEKEESHIELVINKKNIDYCVDMHLKKNSPKGIAINKIPIKKASELFGIINIVFFSPEDLNIIKNGPSERRRFIDLELSQLDKIYLSNLANYNRVVNQRNRLLKDAYDRVELLNTLEIWDMQLIQYGNKIIERRAIFIKQINEIISTIHSKLTGNKEHIELVYEKCTGNLTLDECIQKYRTRDIKMRSTTIGPHRDDIAFLINNIDIRKYGSQGQQRTAALSLKMAEIELVKSIINDTPVLLLDDVLSELDKNRQTYLLENIHDIQTLITCTGVDEFVRNRFNIDKVFYVKNGNIVKEVKED
ncbi:MAG: DNA replication/repair protein RecF [Eubacteriales bacterium]